MPFDLTIWKEKFAARLPSWKARMQQAGVNSTYAFLSAAALWPVVEAARSGEWAAAPATLGAVLAGLGSNLLANQIQGWKDEADAARRLEQAAAEDASLRTELDAVLEKLEALPLAGQALGEADCAWFAQAMQEELARLGSRVTYQATVTGAGAVAQQGGTALGQQAIGAGGDVRESILNTGTLNLLFAQYQAPSGRARLSKDDFERILKEYLDWVVKAYGKARLYGLESMRTTREQPRRQLADVFTPLTLRRFSPPRRDEIEELAGEFRDDPLAYQRAYLRAVDAHRDGGEEVEIPKLLVTHKRLAVIGSAGCGKSTLAAYLAASLAEAALRGDEPPFALPEERRQLLPVVIPLRYYREYQRLCGESPQERLKNPRTGTLAGLIPWYLRRRSPALELSEDFFDRLLLGGGCLLVLDGLDEVVSRAERGRVRAQVEALANDIYPGNLILVTARESGYREDAVFGDDFARLDVQPLSDVQINLLVRNWCRQLYPEAVNAQTAEILDSIRNINQRYQSQNLPPLVSTPLLTTMVVSVKWGENELPRERAKLYEAAVKVILQAQYLESDEAQQELINWGGAWDEQRDWLAHLALEMQRGGPGGVVIPEERVRAILSTCPGMDQEKLDTFIQAVRLRGGLFDERAELFQFAHLTFQEFLAARLLVKQRQEGLKTLRPLAPDPWWREVCLLMYGFAKEDYPPFAIHYLGWLGALTPDEDHLAGLELAAAAVLEIERPDPALRRAQAERLLADIQDVARKTRPTLRARAGDTLAKLGDPRPEVTTIEGMQFCLVPPGPFVMGSNQYDDEKPQHLNECLSYPYWIARCPVTAAQWRAFVEVTGFRPGNNDSLRDPDGRPVRWVSWYESLEFCKWLNSQYIARLPQGYAFGLPSEAEWEKAARGGAQIPWQSVLRSLGDGLSLPGAPEMIANPVLKREHSWEGEFDPNKANTKETGIGDTSAVGCFPSGASPYGALEMIGNVWEWTRSLWGEDWYEPDFKYPYNPQDGREKLDAPREVLRVLRGVSFNYDASYARCACRFRYPNNGVTNGGFRVVVSRTSRKAESE